MPTVQQTTSDAADQELLRLADQCVKCGYCLPACPTYLKTRNEADSPRGRIALVQGWVSGEIPMSEALARHLDGCLTCRACETVCPSLVAYGRLADGAKTRRLTLEPAWRRALLRRALQGLSSASLSQRLAALARRYVSSGLAGFAERAHAVRSPLRRAYHRLAIAMAETSRQPIARSPETPSFDLFVGCTGHSAQGAAIEAAVEVCRRLGLEPRIPTEPECCGAILRHNGFAEEARQHREATAHQHRQRPLVGVASACIAELREQPGLTQTEEICAFIDEQPWPSSLALEPLARRVLVHEPCSHRNLLGGTEAVYRLLRRIPEIDVAPMPGNEHCCGAAGTYLLQQPEMSNALLEDKLETLREQRPDIVVTTNPGCALHLIGGIREAGLAIEVCHPVELIARQLSDADRA